MSQIIGASQTATPSSSLPARASSSPARTATPGGPATGAVGRPATAANTRSPYLRRGEPADRSRRLRCRRRSRDRRRECRFARGIGLVSRRHLLPSHLRCAVDDRYRLRPNVTVLVLVDDAAPVHPVASSAVTMSIVYLLEVPAPAHVHCHVTVVFDLSLVCDSQSVGVAESDVPAYV